MQGHEWRYVPGESSMFNGLVRYRFSGVDYVFGDEHGVFIYSRRRTRTTLKGSDWPSA